MEVSRNMDEDETDTQGPEPVAWMYLCHKGTEYEVVYLGTARDQPFAQFAEETPLSPTSLVVELLDALREAREALHFHYVEWDGEPEDAVPLQLARSKCDAAIARAEGRP